MSSAKRQGISVIHLCPRCNDPGQQFLKRQWIQRLHQVRSSSAIGNVSMGWGLSCFTFFHQRA